MVPGEYLPWKGTTVLGTAVNGARKFENGLTATAAGQWLGAAGQFPGAANAEVVVVKRPAASNSTSEETRNHRNPRSDMRVGSYPGFL